MGLDARLFTTLHDGRTDGGGTVRVLRLDYAAAASAERAAMRALLPPSELGAVERFAFPELRDKALARRAFVRVALGDALGTDPRAVPLVKGRRGRPELLGFEGRFAISLSHTDDAVLLAIASGARVGVDIERRAADIDPGLLAHVVLHPEEARALLALEGDARKRAFLRIWCRKEAALKVTGIGLLDDLTALSVARDVADLGACRDPRVLPEDACVVRIEDLAAGEAHQAALATAPFC